MALSVAQAYAALANGNSSPFIKAQAKKVIEAQGLVAGQLSPQQLKKVAKKGILPFSVLPNQQVLPVSVNPNSINASAGEVSLAGPPPQLLQAQTPGASTAASAVLASNPTLAPAPIPFLSPSQAGGVENLLGDPGTTPGAELLDDGLYDESADMPPELAEAPAGMDKKKLLLIGAAVLVLYLVVR